jgi:hypothetical protein
VTGKPVLAAYNAGSQAVAVEKLSDAQVTAQVGGAGRRAGPVPLPAGLQGPGAAADHPLHPPPPEPPQVTEKLRQMFPSSYVAPTSIFINRWAQDPYSLGSYSFNAFVSSSAGSPKNDRATLGKREGQLFFAGEHAHQTLWATVNGAYLTGKAAAAALLSCRSGGSCP